MSKENQVGFPQKYNESPRPVNNIEPSALADAPENTGPKVMTTADAPAAKPAKVRKSSAKAKK